MKNYDPNSPKKKEIKEYSIKSVMPITERKDVLQCLTSPFPQSGVIRSLLVPSFFYSTVADWASVREKPGGSVNLLLLETPEHRTAVLRIVISWSPGRLKKKIARILENEQELVHR